MCEVGGEHPLCAAVLLLVLRHGKSNSTDESITEVNEDDSTMIHEARRLGLLQVTVFTNTLYEIKSTRPRTARTGHLCCINNQWHLTTSKFSSRASRKHWDTELTRHLITDQITLDFPQTQYHDILLILRWNPASVTLRENTLCRLLGVNYRTGTPELRGIHIFCSRTLQKGVFELPAAS